MPSTHWLKTAFDYGFDSGNVMSRVPNRRRRQQERKIGGSYRRVFAETMLPHLRHDSHVLEVGPGSGSWSRAILKHIPDGELWAADYVDLTDTLKPSGRLVFRQVDDNSFDAFPDGHFDLFFSFGVLCHNPSEAILEILTNARPKMRPGGIAVHQHGDWTKLDTFGWERGEVPVEFKTLPDREIWWPRNDSATMAQIAQQAGWAVITEDVGLLKRDGLIVLGVP